MIFSKRATLSLRALFGTISDSSLFFPLHSGHCCFPIPHLHSAQLPLSSNLFILSHISPAIIHPSLFPHLRQLFYKALLISSCLFIQHLVSIILYPNKQTYTPFPFINLSIITVMAPRAAGAGKPARGWDAASHEDLLLALLEEIKPNKADLTNVAEKMRNKGYSYSYDAIKYFSFCLLRTVSKVSS